MPLWLVLAVAGDRLRGAVDCQRWGKTRTQVIGMSQIDMSMLGKGEPQATLLIEGRGWGLSAMGGGQGGCTLALRQQAPAIALPMTMGGGLTG